MIWNHRSNTIKLAYLSKNRGEHHGFSLVRIKTASSAFQPKFWLLSMRC